MFEHFQPVGQVHQYNNMAPVSGSYPVFSARRKTEQVDWRKIAALNIDQMAQAFDFNTLQENIYSITFCDIESEVVSIIFHQLFIFALWFHIVYLFTFFFTIWHMIIINFFQAT